MCALASWCPNAWAVCVHQRVRETCAVLCETAARTHEHSCGRMRSQPRRRFLALVTLYDASLCHCGFCAAAGAQDIDHGFAYPRRPVQNQQPVQYRAGASRLSKHRKPLNQPVIPNLTLRRGTKERTSTPGTSWNTGPSRSSWPRKARSTTKSTPAETSNLLRLLDIHLLRRPPRALPRRLFFSLGCRSPRLWPRRRRHAGDGAGLAVRGQCPSVDDAAAY